MVTPSEGKDQAAAARPWNEAVLQAPSEAQWEGREPARVLIVEDDEAIRDLLKLILSRQGHQIRAVATGQEGLAAIAEAPVQVLLTDYQLPDLDGLTLLEHVTKRDPRTVGIMITGHGTIELAVKAMRAGAADLITKPFKPNDVVMAVQRVLEVHHLRQENRVLKQAVMRGIRMNPFQLSDIESSAAEGSKSPEYLRGVADGERRMREQVGRMKQEESVLAGMAKQLAQTCAALPNRMEAELFTLAFQIARKVIHACADEKRDLALQLAKDAIARIRDSKVVRLLVHPRDLPLMEGASEALAAGFDGPVTIKVEADATLAPGGCRVQTPTHLVDASLDGQLAKIADGLRGQSNYEAH